MRGLDRDLANRLQLSYAKSASSQVLSWQPPSGGMLAEILRDDQTVRGSSRSPPNPELSKRLLHLLICVIYRH